MLGFVIVGLRTDCDNVEKLTSLEYLCSDSLPGTALCF